MCMISVISDYGSRIPIQNWTRVGYDDFRAAIEAAKRFDASMLQPDCHDHRKDELLARIEARLAAIEKRLELQETSNV